MSLIYGYVTDLRLEGIDYIVGRRVAFEFFAGVWGIFGYMVSV